MKFYGGDLLIIEITSIKFHEKVHPFMWKVSGVGSGGGRRWWGREGKLWWR